MHCPHETFAALSELPVIHAFTGLVPGIDVAVDRETALARLEEAHRDLRLELGLADRRFMTAQQVHGAGVAAVRAESRSPFPEVDALITDDPRVCLGIYVADCGPIFLVDPVRRAIGCVHSGKKGTQLEIARAAVKAMISTYGCDPAQMVAQLGPCIRPPHYDIDFAAEIVRQLQQAGVGSVNDCGSCTAANPSAYYSYRRELGKTGRMVALLALK
jgi:polyphenol oxidase